MLKAHKRHYAPCKRDEWDQGYTKCKCPVVIIGTLPDGNRLRLSTAKYLPPERARDLESARDLAILWERVGSAVRPEEYAQIPASDPGPEEPASAKPTVEMAVSTFMKDALDRGNSEATVYKKKVVFEKLLKRFCKEKGIRFLSELGLECLARMAWHLESRFPFQE